MEHSDPVVRGCLVLEDGEMRCATNTLAALRRAKPRSCRPDGVSRPPRSWPAPPLPAPAAPAKKPEAAAKGHEAKVEDPFKAAMTTALTTTAGLGGVVALSLGHPAPAFTSMLTKFGLSVIGGYQTVWGVQVSRSIQSSCAPLAIVFVRQTLLGAIS